MSPKKPENDATQLEEAERAQQKPQYNANWTDQFYPRTVRPVNAFPRQRHSLYFSLS